jgi:DNA-binding LacI/PurR family transcriptional regulator
MIGVRITQQDIATRAGVHVTTVSLALRNHPSLPAVTRDKIQNLANEMGYRPDPALSALMAYRRGTKFIRHDAASRAAKGYGNVAWVTNYPTRNGWSAGSGTCFALYRDSAAERLARHGYRLEEFWLREPGLTAKRASQILFSRGIRGLLICPLPTDRGHLSLDWEKFSAVSFGYSIVRPKLHLFTSAHYRAVITAMRELRSLGYRRIGLVISSGMDERMDRLWSSAYRSQMTIVPQSQSIPVLTYEEDYPSYRESHYLEGRKAFGAWFQRHRPEAVISTSYFLPQWADELGYRIPGDLGVVNPILQEKPEARGISCIVESSRQIGQAAADFLVAMMQRGEYGVPESPQQILIEGKWFQGNTVKEKTAAVF